MAKRRRVEVLELVNSDQNSQTQCIPPRATASISSNGTSGSHVVRLRLPGQIYLESDPIGLRGGTNTYSYAALEPLSKKDPLGLDWVLDRGANTLSQVDSSGNVLQSWDANSGPFGKGPLPSGEYELPKSPVPVPPDHPRQKSFCDPSGNCWWQPLTPKFPTDRGGFGIHPDGNRPGTLGCVGATAKDTSDLFEALKKDQGPLTVK